MSYVIFPGRISHRRDEKLALALRNTTRRLIVVTYLKVDRKLSLIEEIYLCTILKLLFFLSFEYTSHQRVL